jgi:hypothetical protein
MQIADYWSKPPVDQGQIRSHIEQEEAAEEAERKRIVGYIVTFEKPDWSNPAGVCEKEYDVIFCAECYGDPEFSLETRPYEPITQEEYLDPKYDGVYKTQCSECGRSLE